MVTVTDSRGCVQTKQYVITRPDPISIDVSTQLIFDCNVKTVSLKNIALASGGVPPFIYDWSSGTVSGIDKTVMETDQNGVVILMVTDALGCSANKTLNIDVPKIEVLLSHQVLMQIPLMEVIQYKILFSLLIPLQVITKRLFGILEMEVFLMKKIQFIRL